MALEVQRVRYFTGEFLQEADFNAEQAYNIRMRYLHNRWLHTWGIATGLEVTAGPGPSEVTVGPGMAIVRVTEARIPEFTGEDVAKELVLTSSTVVSIPPAGPGLDQFYVVVSYGEQSAQPVGTGDTRWLERPSLQAVPASGGPPPDNQSSLILARVQVAGGGITAIDISERRAAGVRGEIEATRLRLPVAGISDQTQWPSLGGGAANRLDLAGTLNLTGGNVTLGAGATVDGRDVSADGAALDSHRADMSSHVSTGNLHDHTGGNGAPIPWNAVTGVPDFLIKAYASISGTPPTPTLVRSFNVVSVSRSGAAGGFTVTYQAVANPVFFVTVQASANLFAFVTTSTPTTATINVVKADGTLTDPTRVNVFII